MATRSALEAVKHKLAFAYRKPAERRTKVDKHMIKRLLDEGRSLAQELKIEFSMEKPAIEEQLEKELRHDVPVEEAKADESVDHSNVLDWGEEEEVVAGAEEEVEQEAEEAVVEAEDEGYMTDPGILEAELEEVDFEDELGEEARAEEGYQVDGIWIGDFQSGDFVEYDAPVSSRTRAKSIPV